MVALIPITQDIWSGFGYVLGNAINWVLGGIMALIVYLLYRRYAKMLPGKTVWSTRVVARITIFLALAIVGSYISLGPTVALDSAPGFFAAGYFGLIEGATVLALGCLVSHFFKGLIGLIPIVWTSYPAMALAGACYAFFYGKSTKIEVFSRRIVYIVLAIITATAVNVFGCLGPLVFVWGLSSMLPYFPILAEAALVNTVLAAVLLEALRKFRPQTKVIEEGEEKE